MAIRNILNKREKLLRSVCKPVERFDDKLGELLDDMSETMHQANGVGLAAPQVGYLKRAVVIDTGDNLLELINPAIVEFSGSQRDVEGCLSCPGEYGYVTRPERCIVRAQDRYGKSFETELFDLEARCAFHELDHLDGKLFLDIVEEMVDVDEEEE